MSHNPVLNGKKNLFLIRNALHKAPYLFSSCQFSMNSTQTSLRVHDSPRYRLAPMLAAVFLLHAASGNILVLSVTD